MEPPMQPFSPAALLDLWESGRPQHSLDRALTILAAAAPNESRDALAQLSIGERDARLLHLRALVCGARAEGFAECPSCAEELEFALDTSAFFAPNELTDQALEIEMAGQNLRFRLPNSRDLAEVAQAPDSRHGLRLLLARCLSPNDGNLPNELPNEFHDMLGRAILAADPRAEVSLELHCPACAHRWSLLFDVIEFFWKEISAQARQLLREIDALARAYGWSEREILGLPPRRRQSYLELIAA